MRYVIFGLISVAFGIWSTLVTATDNEINVLRVYKDQSRILKFDRSALRVIIGNAEVADVTVADAQTVVVTGKNFGATNLVVLDGDGNTLLDEEVLVSINEGSTVRLYQSTKRTVLSCTPDCERHRDSQ